MNAARQGEQGGIALMTALMLTVLVAMGVAVVLFGQLSFHRRTLQSAADALALAAAYSLEQNGLPYRAPRDALRFATANSQLALRPQFGARTENLANNVADVDVGLRATFDFGARVPLLDRIFQINATARAQINVARFGTVWPAVVMVLDASESMRYPILAANGRSAFQVMQSVLTAYTALTLPVRNGLIVFSDGVTQNVAPSAANLSNARAIGNALTAAAPNGRTNAAAALDAARAQLAGIAGGHNAVLISDGEPTLGGPCAPHAACHFNAGTQAGARLRARAQGAAAIFTVEIRRTNYATQASDFLIGVSGLPGSAGGDGSMRYLAQDTLGITMFIAGLTRAICAFGPLVPGAGAPASARRPRAVTPNLLTPRQRVFTFIRQPNGNEVAVPLLADNDRDRHPRDPGFQYWRDAVRGEDWVILTERSCQFLGGDGARTVVVRWDDAQLIPST
ncbi:MAG: VWA domain-containing protein [Proteobacteria bacterium]|nr:VWA domain-containing protein [Pseudomonadota bacterium]